MPLKFFKNLFNGQNSNSHDAPDDGLPVETDPEMIFHAEWDDSKRLAFCKEALEKVKAALGGNLKRTDEHLRLYTRIDNQPLRIEVDWCTGDLDLAVTGENTLGCMGLCRDIDDMDYEDTSAASDDEWETEEDEEIDLKHYVVPGIYMENTKDELSYEQQRYELVPQEIKKEILSEMTGGRLKWVYALEDSVSCTWDGYVIREKDLTLAVTKHSTSVMALFQVFNSIQDPDPNAGHDLHPDSHRCSYCNARLSEGNATRCKECGAPL